MCVLALTQLVERHTIERQVQHLEMRERRSEAAPVLAFTRHRLVAEGHSAHRHSAGPQLVGHCQDGAEDE